MVVLLSNNLIFSFVFIVVVLLSLSPAFGLTVTKVAVIGATGRLGREVVQQLASVGIRSRCLVRQLPSNEIVTAESTKKTSVQVAADLKAKFSEYIEFVRGDVSDIESLRSLVSGCDTCLALFGPTVPKPFFKALFPFWYTESDPQHPYNVNYNGMKNLIAVLLQENPSIRLVRITGKGEDPWSIFSILINAFGGIAKGWNYEGEQLLRKSSVDYTIIRPGVLKEQLDDEGNDPPPQLALLDNGRNLPVTAVSYAQIAQLIIQCMTLDNCKRATITAMNPVVVVPKHNLKKNDRALESSQDGIQTLEQIRPDTRAFPESLIREHKQAARVGGLTILGITAWLVGKLVTILIHMMDWTTWK
jgi:hypothetical protein